MHIRSFDYDDVKKIEFRFTRANKKFAVAHCQNIITFDIETSNGFLLKDSKRIVGFDQKLYDTDKNYRDMIDSAEPQSLLYVWQCSVESFDGHIYTFFGRTWEDYLDFLLALTTEIKRYELFGTKGIYATPIEYSKANVAGRKVKHYQFVHNLGFEFQHLLNIFSEEFTYKKKNQKTEHIFARTAHHPMKAYLTYNSQTIEYRDTLCLTQKSLKNWCKDENLPVQKLSEPKDYYLPIRTPETPLTDEEWNYSENDVVSMVYGLKKYRDKYETLQNIPITQTGEVRRTVHEKVCKANPAWATLCTEITKSYTLDFYNTLRNLFAGGWTHANSLYTNMLLHNVRCFDFASSYPAVMTMRTMPIGMFVPVDVRLFNKYDALDLKDPNLKEHWFMKVKLDGVKTKLSNTLWSSSKCIDKCNAVVDNGRIYSADSITILVTDLDWDTFKQAYNYRSMEVLELYAAESGYLPKELVVTILEYYGYKTSLKNVPGAESKYAESKQWINSIYGCFVTKTIDDELAFFSEDDEAGDPMCKWARVDLTEEMYYKKLEQTSDKTTFGTFQLGVWVTAWARHNLWDAIIKFDDKIAYCDTDSCKGLFSDDDLKWFDAYNDDIAKIQEEVAAIIGFDKELYNPTTPKGVHKRLGIFAEEEECVDFKTLGAKKYVDMIINDKGEPEIQSTIAGLPKYAGVNKFKKVSDFKPNTTWTTGESGKLTSCFNSNQKPGIWVDRDGNEYDPSKNSFYPQYGICLKPTTFSLNLSEDYDNFLTMLRYGSHSVECEGFVENVADLFR